MDLSLMETYVIVRETVPGDVAADSKLTYFAGKFSVRLERRLK